MTKDEFLEMIKSLGFQFGYTSWHLILQINQNHTYCSFNIVFVDDDSKFILRLLKQVGGITSGGSDVIFQLNGFGEEGDQQILIFLRFLNSGFISETGSANSEITKRIRERSIGDILR